MFDHVYAEPHQQLIEDRAFLAHYLQPAPSDADPWAGEG
jgi:hypothetical protein